MKEVFGFTKNYILKKALESAFQALQDRLSAISTANSDLGKNRFSPNDPPDKTLKTRFFEFSSKSPILSGYNSRLFEVPYLLPIIIRCKITTPAIWEMSGLENTKITI